MKTQVLPAAGQARRSSLGHHILGVLAAALFQFSSSWAIAGESCPYDQWQNVTLTGSVWDNPLKRDDGLIVVAVKTVECPDDVFNLFANPQVIQLDGCAKGSKVNAAGQINSIASIFPGRIFNITASSSTCIASQHDARDNCFSGRPCMLITTASKPLGPIPTTRTFNSISENIITTKRTTRPRYPHTSRPST